MITPSVLLGLGRHLLSIQWDTRAPVKNGQTIMIIEEHHHVHWRSWHWKKFWRKVEKNKYLKTGWSLGVLMIYCVLIITHLNYYQKWTCIFYDVIKDSYFNTFGFIKRQNYDVGKNIVLNRMHILNNKIDKNWINLTVETYKVKCKEKFLKPGNSNWAPKLT